MGPQKQNPQDQSYLLRTFSPFNWDTPKPNARINGVVMAPV